MKRNTKHWVDEEIWEDKDFGRWFNKNSFRTVQFAKYRGPDGFDKYMMKLGHKPYKWWNKWYLEMWGGGRADKLLLFDTKKEAMTKLKRLLGTSDMKYKLEDVKCLN